MPRRRFGLLVICALLAVLVAMFVWAGTMQPGPANNDYPTEEQLVSEPDRYVGDRVSVAGTVVGVDPLTIEATPRPGVSIRFEVTGSTADPAVGDALRVHGVLREGNRIDALAAVHREPWEAAYMYVVSFLGGALVLGRLVAHWTFDPGRLAIVPRNRPPHGRTEETDA